MTELHYLLDQRARRGSVHPSIEGVQHAIGRRKAHRRRQRTIGGGIAAVCLLTAVAVGAALSSGRDTPEQPMTFTGLPEVPNVGLELEGFDQHEPRIQDFDGDELPRSVAVFRSGGSITDPFATVSVQPPVDGEPPELPEPPDTDLDGDGRPDAAWWGTDAGYHLWWRLDDGSLVTFENKIADSQPSRWQIGYARQIYGPTLDLETIPAPEGLPEREVVTLPDPGGPVQAEVTYEADNGARQITVVTTNQPGWLDLVQTGAPYPDSGLLDEELALGPSFLGSGHAFFLPTDYASGINNYDAYALVETDSGLTLEITTYGVGPDVLTDLIQTGAFVDVGPSEAPAPTTVVEPTPTTSVVEPVTPTTVGGSTTRITGIHLEPGSELDRLEISFSGVVPDYELTTSPEAVDVDCYAPVSDNGDYLVLRLSAPPGTGLDEWEGHLEISPDPDGAIQGVLSCGWSDEDDAVYVSIELDRLREGETYLVPGMPTLVLDVPRS